MLNQVEPAERTNRHGDRAVDWGRGLAYRPSIYESPLVHSRTLSRLTGNTIFLKLENLQMIGSFKGRGPQPDSHDDRRGAPPHHLRLRPATTRRAWPTISTQRNIPVQIWMPRSTPLVKLSATRNHGADVVLHGENYDEACQAAMERSQERHATFIHPFDDDEVIAGQGTLGLELLRQNPTLDVIVVPVGGGGLIGA